MSKLLFRILKIAAKEKFKLIVSIILAFLKSISLKVPLLLLIYLLTHFYNQDLSANQCYYGLYVLLINILLQIIIQYLLNRTQSASGYKIFAQIRLDLAQKLQRLPLGYFTEDNIAKLATLLSNDINFIEENVMNKLAELLNCFFSQLLVLLLLYNLHPLLCISSLIIILIVVIIAKLLRNTSAKESLAKEVELEELSNAVIEFCEGMSTIKSLNLFGTEAKDLQQRFQSSCDRSLQFEKKYRPYNITLYALYGIGTALIILIGYLLYQNKQLTALNLISLLIFSYDLFTPLKNLYDQTAQLSIMEIGLDKIEEIMDTKELENKGKKPFPRKLNITFENVSFAYEKRYVLKDLNLKIKDQTICALVGPSGSGKTTLTSLLARMWDYQEGKISINDTDIKEIALSDYLKNISIVFQNVYLFQDSIRNNLLLAKSDATDTELLEACKKARCYDFIMSLPEGLDTLVGEGGATLSGGERQRLSIARAILKDASLIILDEATAAIDSDNESYIQEALNELLKDKTAIVIAHKLETIKNADQIVVLDEGQIVELGTHEQLLNNNKQYKRMLESLLNQKEININN